MWTSIRGSNYRSDLAIDSVKILRGSCSDQGTECTRKDCVWNEWSSWGSCIMGSQTRSRTVRTQGSCGGNECQEARDSLQSKACCQPVDCVWDNWSDWSTCNLGVQRRWRRRRVNADCGGKRCDGPEGQEQACCTPKDCTWREWSEWSACLNGRKSRSRRVNQEPSCGGKCEGSKELTVTCESNPGSGDNGEG